MKTFESLVATLLLRTEGYWTYPSYNVVLSRDEKEHSGQRRRRWEIDVLAYCAKTNNVLLVECKSFLNSRGVVFCNGEFGNPKRYKFFTNDTLLLAVKDAVRREFIQREICPTEPDVTLCLATGKIAKKTNRPEMQEHFDRVGWRLFDDYWIRERVRKLADRKYEDDLAVLVAKLMTS